jgi:hypothetical protein
MYQLAKGAALAVVLLTCVPALAQSPAQQQGATGGAVTGVVGGAIVGAVVGGPVGAVVGGIVGGTAGAAAGSLTADDRVYVRQYVYGRQVEPVMMQQAVVVGEPVPAGVTVYSFDNNPRLATYKYAYINRQYVLIDQNGRVMETIQQ